MTIKTKAILLTLLLTTMNIDIVNATLLGRLPTTASGSDYQAYYDTVLDITWLANANLAASNQFGMTLSNNTVDLRDNVMSLGGAMTWTGVNTWLDNLNNANYLGFNQWRLPTMMNPDTPCNSQTDTFAGGDCGWNVRTTNPKNGTLATTVYSEFASLYFDTLGNFSRYNSNGVQIKQPDFLANAGPFTNIQHSSTPARYWIGLEDSTSTNQAWSFAFGPGQQFSVFETQPHFVMLVIDGDVSQLASTIPEPNTIWLFISGLIALSIARNESKKIL